MKVKKQLFINKKNANRQEEEKNKLTTKYQTLGPHHSTGTKRDLICNVCIVSFLKHIDKQFQK